MKRSLPVLAALCGVAVGLAGCVNVFDPIDNPSGDAQILSAARAAFDRGDVATARDLYGKIAGNEQATMELIFVDMDACGANIEAFGSALGNGTSSTASPGILFTVMAEKMAPLHSTACLATLLSAYQRAYGLTDVRLRGFAGLLAAMSIAGEVIAHNSNVQDGSLLVADYIKNPTDSTGTAGNCPLCAGSSCVPTGGDNLGGGATPDLQTASSITATWGTVQAAINEMQSRLTDLNIQTGAAFQLMHTIQTAGFGNPSNDTYRCLLQAVGLGR